MTFTFPPRGPVPPYANPPIEPQYFRPKRFDIEDITLGQTTIVETTVVMDYVIGQLVRLLIPQNFGCYQLNEVYGYVIAIPSSTEVEIDIDSSVNVDQYISATSANIPQIIAVGDINSGQINSSGRISNLTYIPGSFQNISPL